MNPQNAGRIEDVECDVFLEDHVDFVDGLLAPRVAAQFQAHVDVCAPCSRYDRVVRQGRSLLQDLPEVMPSDDFEMRLQHRLFHLQDEAMEQPRAFGGAAALAVAASIALVAWSPMVVRMTGDGDAVRQQSAGPVMDVQLTDPLFQGAAVWYPAPVSAPAPTATLAAFPGPYSPLVVQPPVHRAVRTISSEYGPLD